MIIDYGSERKLCVVHTPVWEFPSLVHEGDFVKYFYVQLAREEQVAHDY